MKQQPRATPAEVCALLDQYPQVQGNQGAQIVADLLGYSNFKTIQAARSQGMRRNDLKLLRYLLQDEFGEPEK